MVSHRGYKRKYFVGAFYFQNFREYNFVNAEKTAGGFGSPELPLLRAWRVGLSCYRLSGVTRQRLDGTTPGA